MCDVDKDQVVLLDNDRRPSGQMSRRSVHSKDTPLHLAFSLYLFNRSHEVLMTRRSLSKSTWPGVWTNTCCGHPRPAETIDVAVRRRLSAELGLTVSSIECVMPSFSYQAYDFNGICENEVCPVYVGLIESHQTPSPDAAEVMDWVWTDWTDTKLAIERAPFAFSPWSVLQTKEISCRIPATLELETNL
jgi:isopentenyl-diphosphate delta-isomerase type 1